MNRLIVEAVALALIALGVGLYLHHVKMTGAKECLQANAVAVGKQRTADALVYGEKVKVVNEEKAKYEQDLLSPVTNMPVYRIMRVEGSCVSMPLTAAATQGNHGGAPIRSSNSGQPPTTWSSAPLVQAGKDADAQVTVLEDYVRRVCLQNRRTK